MTTFHSRQSDCDRRTHKNENAATVNFAPQFAPSIYTVAFTKREKSDATIFKSRCSRTVLCYRFDRVEALLLSKAKFFQLATGSPLIQRNPARRSRDGRKPSGRTSGEMSRVMSVQVSGSSRAVTTAMPPSVRQDDPQDNLPCGVQFARQELARQRAKCPGSSRAAVQATTNAISHELLAGFSSSAFKHDIRIL
jgi:hypothetical protein